MITGQRISPNALIELIKQDQDSLLHQLALVESSVNGG